jgi:flagellar motor switch protein FliN/FliY
MDQNANDGPAASPNRPSAAPTAKAPELTELAPGAGRGGAGFGGSLDTLLDVSMPVAIEFGRTHLTVQEVLDLGNGSVIQLDRMVGEPIDIFISDRKLAEGEVVVIGEHFGVRITRILSGAAQTAMARETA